MKTANELKSIEYAIYEETIEANGYLKQHVVAMEEASELIQAISKMVRLEGDRERNRANLIEEMEDVEIMLEQLAIMYDIEPSEIAAVRAKKLNRLNDRFLVRYARKRDLKW